ncbi:MAG: hypothetical protein E2P01_04760, partial [Acidobacteria bacterium]
LMAHPFDPVGPRFLRAPFPIAEQVLHDTDYDRSVFAVSSNGVLVYEIGGATEGSRLIWFDRDGRELGELGEASSYQAPVISPDGRFVAMQINDADGSPDLWIHDLERDIRSRFTFDPRGDVFPVWSPDGSTLLFSSDRGPRLDLYLKSVDGTEDVRLLLATDVNKWPMDWSSDGRFVLYSSLENPKTLRDAWVLPMEEGAEPWPLLESTFVEADPRFSPDVRWVSYHSNESGRNEVYVVPFPGPGRKWQISTAGGSRAHWNADGTEIVYKDFTSELISVAVDGSTSTFRVGQATELFGIQPASPFWQFDAAADMQRFLVNTSTQEGSAEPLVVVQNWTAEIPD